MFTVTVEETVFTDVDIVALGGGVRLVAFTLETAQIVSDGFLSIALENSVPAADKGKCDHRAEM